MVPAPGGVLLRLTSRARFLTEQKKKDMKKILTNTRFALLLILGGVAFTLIAAEYESFALTVFCKVVGFVIASIAYLLARYWHAKGRLQEWDEWSQD